MGSVVLLLILNGLPVQAPTTGAGSLVVTEGDFLAAFGPEHPAWQAIEGGVMEAEADVRRADTLPNPTVAFGREAPEGLPAENTWLLAWTPPLDGRRGPTRDAAAAGLRAARARRSADHLSARGELRRAYAEWAVAVFRVNLVASHVRRLERTAEVLGRRAESGEASGLAARRIELSAGEARVRLARAEADRARAVAAVRGLWPALPEGAQPELPEVAAPPAAADVSARPDLVALDERVRQAELQAKAAGRYWGFPEIAFGWQTLRGEALSLDGPVLSVSWSVPLFDRDQGRRAAAEGRARVLAARHTLAHTRAAAEVEGARAAHVALAAAARRAAESARTAETVVRGTLAAFEAGEVNVTDLNDSLRAAFAAEIQALELRGEALGAERALEAALGRVIGTGGVR